MILLLALSTIFVEVNHLEQFRLHCYSRFLMYIELCKVETPIFRSVATPIILDCLQVLRQAYSILSSEMVFDPALGRTGYKATLLASFFYKGMLALRPPGSVPPRLRSAVFNVSSPTCTARHLVRPTFMHVLGLLVVRCRS